MLYEPLCVLETSGCKGKSCISILNVTILFLRKGQPLTYSKYYLLTFFDATGS